MKRIAAILLASCLLAGCGAAGTMDDVAVLPAATAETAGQSLTVYCDAPEQSALRAALQQYSDAQGVTVTYTQDAAAADLALLSAMPEGDGWQDLTGQPLLAAAASRAGLPAEGQDTVTALPLGRSLYAYWANGELLTALLGETCLTDLQNASWAEWSALVQDLTAWLDAPAETALTLNGNAYTLPAQAPEAAAGLQGVFAVPGGEPAAAWSGAALTGALLAAGDERTDTALTGPLNGVYSALTLELENAAWADSTAAAMQAVQGRTALFCRGSLADWLLYSGGAAAETLCWLPVKCDLVESDLGETEYNLTGLLNYPVLAGEAWLAVPAGADEARTEAAAAAMLWLYTSQAGEETLTQTLGLVTPWGTASNDTPLTAMQVEQVGAGILPEPALDTAAAAGLGEAARALARDEDGALRTRFTASHRSAWREAAIAALQPPEAPETTQE